MASDGLIKFYGKVHKDRLRAVLEHGRDSALVLVWEELATSTEVTAMIANNQHLSDVISAANEAAKILEQFEDRFGREHPLWEGIEGQADEIRESVADYIKSVGGGSGDADTPVRFVCEAIVRVARDGDPRGVHNQLPTFVVEARDGRIDPTWYPDDSFYDYDEQWQSTKIFMLGHEGHWYSHGAIWEVVGEDDIDWDIAEMLIPPVAIARAEGLCII